MTAPGTRRRFPRWAGHLIGLAVLMVALLTVRVWVLPDPSVPAPILGDRLVVVGVTGRDVANPVDRDMLDAHATTSAYGVLSTERAAGECVSAVWLAIGAGERARTGADCDPGLELSPEARTGAVGGAAIGGWDQLVALNRAAGTELAGGTTRRGLVPGDRCVAAVGPGAALAAADADGVVARYQDPAAWLAAGYASPCPVTLVDVGAASDTVIRGLAGAPGVTLLVLGLGSDEPSTGPAAGVPRTMPTADLAYRIDPAGSGAVAGLLASPTTGHAGVLDVSDVVAVIDSVLAAGGSADEAGAAPRAVPAGVSAEAADAYLEQIARLRTRVPILAVFGALLVVGVAAGAVMVLRRRWAHTRELGAALTTWPVALLAAGAVPWYATAAAVLAGIGAVLAAWALAAGLARLIATDRRPVGIAGAALALTVTSGSAALGGWGTWGTLLDSTTALGPDWGIGPGVGGICVGAALTIAAWWAERLRGPRSTLAIGALVVLAGIVLVPRVPYVVALVVGGLILAVAARTRGLVHQAVPWADPLFVGGAVASLAAALTGTALDFLGSGVVELRAAPAEPLFGGILMGWFGSVTVALWLELRAPGWFAARDAGQLPDPTLV